MRDITILQDFQVHVKVPKHRFPSLVRWIRPIEGRKKLIVDGASRGNPGLAGVGGVLWDSDGNMRLAFCCASD